MAILAGGGIAAGCAEGARSSVPTVEIAPPTEDLRSEPSAQPLSQPKPARAREMKRASNCCKGMNACKGKGMCKTDKHACKGINDCKAQGGCKASDCDEP